MCIFIDSDILGLQTMDKEFRKWSKWYGKTYSDYKVTTTIYYMLNLLLLRKQFKVQISVFSSFMMLLFYLPDCFQLDKGDFLRDDVKEKINHAA